VTGGVKLNGYPRTEEDMRTRAAYLMQSDHLMAFLTVRESLMYIARLRLPSSMTTQKKKARVDAIIAELGLRHVADSQVGGTIDLRGISGGERRRVSIGVQLLTNPTVLLCDEPTSG
jgi:ABC-type multidrug transport system ATPase subunit